MEDGYTIFKFQFKMRNLIRKMTRDAMSDTALATELNRTHPNMTWNQIVIRYQGRGLSGDTLWQAILDSSTRSNEAVNQAFGIR